MIVILGPTATGKTKLAAQVAASIEGEIISADSRQVYRGMDIGTGKDYSDYVVNGIPVAYHLVDIAEPGTEYNVFRFLTDFKKAYSDITKRGKECILCGGTGLYLDAAIRDYNLLKVPENDKLRDELASLSLDELGEILKRSRRPHNVTDLENRDRLLRAIEIDRYYEDHGEGSGASTQADWRIYGILCDRQKVRERITDRLIQRLDEGLVNEVKGLLNGGLAPSQLMFYGLEYRYVTGYVTGETGYDEMFSKLNTAIHQFAKRQMTWFRRMEKQGVAIEWLNCELSNEEKMKIILSGIK